MSYTKFLADPPFDPLHSYGQPQRTQSGTNRKNHHARQDPRQADDAQPGERLAGRLALQCLVDEDLGELDPAHATPYCSDARQLTCTGSVFLHRPVACFVAFVSHCLGRARHSSQCPLSFTVADLRGWPTGCLHCTTLHEGFSGDPDSKGPFRIQWSRSHSRRTTTDVTTGATLAPRKALGDSPNGVSDRCPEKRDPSPSPYETGSQLLGCGVE